MTLPDESSIEIISDNLIKLRSNNQVCELGAVIGRPATVYSMRINQIFATVDMIASLEFDGGEGVASDVLAGMTLLVSGVAAGGHEKGVMRVRGITFTSEGVGVIDTNEVSNVRFANDDYLTVVESMAIWQRDVKIVGGIVYMDYDIPFGDYRLGGAVGRIGPQVSIIKIDPDTLLAEFNPLDPSLSACYDGATIISHHFVCPDAASITGADTTTPTITFDTPGQYLWWDEITDSRGRVTPTYRWAYVNPVSEKFKLLKCTGDLNGKGWSIKMRTSSNLGDVYDRAMVTLYSVYESYDNVEGIIGPLPGYENIKVTGWIDGKTINMNTVEGYAEFEVKSANFWASKLRAFPFGVGDTSTDPVNWVTIKELTLDKALAHLLFWCSTMTSVIDCYFSGDTIRHKGLSSPAGNLWQQIADISVNTIHAEPRVNRFGQLFVQVNTQFISATDMDLVPVIQHIEQDDYQNGLELTINDSEKTSLLEMSGVGAWDGNVAPPLFSRAPGSVGATFGEPRNADNFSFIDQDDCNRRAGRYYAVENNELDPFDIELSGQNIFFDVAPRQLATIDVSADENPLGFAMTAAKIVPRAIDLEYNEETMFLKTTISFEFVPESVDGIAYVPPMPLQEDTQSRYIMPKMKVPIFPVKDLGGYFPPFVPPILPYAPCGSAPSQYRAAWTRSELRGDDPVEKRIADLPFRCIIRPKSYNFVSPSQVAMAAHPYGDARGKYHLFGIKGGQIVASADSSGVFDPAGEIEVDGFRIILDEGLGTDVEYVPLGEIANGVINATAIHRKNITIPGNSILSIEDVGGPWIWIGGGNEIEYGVNLWAEDSYVGPGDGTLLVSRSLIGAIDLYTEDVDANHKRTYFSSGAYTSVWVFTSDGSYPDNATTNSGSISYRIRMARADGRRVVLGSPIVKNVCTVVL